MPLMTKIDPDKAIAATELGQIVGGEMSITTRWEWELGQMVERQERTLRLMFSIGPNNLLSSFNPKTTAVRFKERVWGAVEMHTYQLRPSTLTLSFVELCQPTETSAATPTAA